jgi:eukaryotic-like serine/threonine-protein kinase
VQPGDVVANRFEIERFAGVGGMGTVYRALDRETGTPVALKILLRGSAERFLREARVLAELAHPRIVRHVAHGALPHGDPYLAMEWLQGEDLAHRLERGPLSVSDGVTVGRAVADALSAAHARGVVHRDLKPSNLFLVDGDIARLRVLDFGAARVETSAAPTATGIVLGTPGYMAPEQVRGERGLDGRADVFALGCVLFECMTGRPTFVAQHVLALLGKILLEEPPLLRELVPDAPQALEDLLKRMLAKEPSTRPAGGAALLHALDHLGPLGPASTTAPERTCVTERERRLVTIVMASVPGEARLAESVRGRARTVAARFGAEVEWVGEGSMIVVLSARGTARDQAASAARCALAVAAELSDALVVVATGRGEISTVLPIGEVMERAAKLLAHDLPSGAGRIRLDEATAALLDARFDIVTAEDGHILAGERVSEAIRTLFGRPSPCVGRDKELALLQATCDESAAEHASRTVLVVGEAGLGKSRLRHELCTRLRAGVPEPRLLVAQADVVGAGSPLGLARQLVTRAAEVSDTDAPALRREKLAAHLHGRIPESEARWVAEFLAELLGGDSSLSPSDELRAARGDPAIMGEWLRRTFERWLEIECAGRPLVIVLDDLHWGDAASLTLLGGAMLRLRDRPFFVLALARPEIRDVFPRLWAGLDLQTIQLLPLSRGASEKLVRSVLGEGVAPDTVARVVERAAGNAFFLEELMRHTAVEAEPGALPSTVLAMIESRIARLDAPLRRTLRAGSVFGRTLWVGGVRALLGAESVEAVAADLDALVAAELLIPGSGTRFVGEREYAFRHDLLRQAAGAMLTADDELTAHKLAGEWLESAGERDALAMAGHFEKGGAPERAVAWLVRAVRDASEGYDWPGVHALVRRAVGVGASGGELGILRSIESLAFVMDDAQAEAHAAASTAVRLVQRGSSDWFLAAAAYAFTGMKIGALGAVVEVMHALQDLPPGECATGPAAMVATQIVTALLWANQYEGAVAYMRRLDEVDGPDIDAAFVAWRTCARCVFELYGGEDPGCCIRTAQTAQALLERLGDQWGRRLIVNFLALAYAFAGDLPTAEATARAGLQGTDEFTRKALHETLALTLTWAGRFDEALAYAEPLVRGADPVAAHTPRSLLALIHLHRGDVDGAEREAHTILEHSAGLAYALVAGHGLLAEVALARGMPDIALREVDESQNSVAGGVPVAWGTYGRLTRAKVLVWKGDVDGALGVLREARDRLLHLADTFDDDGARRRFLSLDWNAKTMELARHHLGEVG